MHDPLSQLFAIKYPWKNKHGYRNSIIEVWHEDPCCGGNDDSCGRFKRAHHGNKGVLEKIVRRFESDWDRVFQSDAGLVYSCGFFHPNGLPHLSPIAISLNLFFLAALEHFGSRDKASRFIQKNLFEIMLFAENPFDSLHDTITGKFRIGCNEKYRAEDHRRNMAAIIYGWILREDERWYQKPLFHFHHWRVKVVPLRNLWNWLFLRCSRCGSGFKWKESRIGNWEGTSVWHERCSAASECPSKDSKAACS